MPWLQMQASAKADRSRGKLWKVKATRRFSFLAYFAGALGGARRTEAVEEGDDDDDGLPLLLPRPMPPLFPNPPRLPPPPRRKTSMPVVAMAAALMNPSPSLSLSKRVQRWMLRMHSICPCPLLLLLLLPCVAKNVSRSRGANMSWLTNFRNQNLCM